MKECDTHTSLGLGTEVCYFPSSESDSKSKVSSLLDSNHKKAISLFLLAS